MERLKAVSVRTVNQSELTSDCWSVQVWGIEHCKTCQYLNTKECGGEEILKKVEKGQYPSAGIGQESGKS